MNDFWAEPDREVEDAVDALEELEIFQTTGRLLAALERGNEAAREELQRRLEPAVFGYVRRLGGSYDLARDAAREVLSAFLTLEATPPPSDAPSRLADRLRPPLESWLSQRDPERLDRPRRTLDLFFEQEWRDALVRASLERVLSEVGEDYFEVYRRVVLLNEKAEKVSRNLDLTHLAVTTRTQRISHRIRNLRAALEDERRLRS